MKRPERANAPAFVPTRQPAAGIVITRINLVRFACDVQAAVGSSGKPTVSKIVKPGQRVPDSGIYRDTKSGERATLVRGKTAPPTPDRGGKWREVVDTNPRDRSSR